MIDFNPVFYRNYISPSSLSKPRTKQKNAGYSLLSTDCTHTNCKYTIKPDINFSINGKNIGKITLEATPQELAGYVDGDVNGFRISLNDEPLKPYSQINEALDPDNRVTFKNFVRPLVLALVTQMQKDEKPIS
jgi:hypothetical protein